MLFLCFQIRTFEDYSLEEDKMEKKIFETKFKDNSEIEVGSTQYYRRDGDPEITVDVGTQLLFKQIRIENLRPATIKDYEKWWAGYTDFANVKYLSELNQEQIYSWLASMDVQNSTRLIRLKSVKACLGRLYNMGYFRHRWWRSINIKVDIEKKEATPEETLGVFFKLIDLTDFFELRDAIAVLMIYQTGVRINTLVQIKEEHLDLNNQLLKLSGQIMKSRQELELPISNQLTQLIKALIEENNKVREYKKQDNTFLFISRNGKTLLRNGRTTTIQKRMVDYSNRWGLIDFTPHALRRGFARNLYNKGANVPIISKALGHNDLKVTSRYLNISNDELVDNLKRFID